MGCLTVCGCTEMATFAQTLRHQLTIQVQSTARSGGQKVEVWTELRKTFANIRVTSGAEAIRAGAVMGTVNVSIRIRWCTDVTNGMRVVHGAVVYKIVSVQPDGARAHVDLVCEVTK